MERPDDAPDPLPAPGELWLGYARLVIPFELISAMLVYQPIWDRRIVQCYGSLPSGIRAVVLLTNGQVLPSSRALAELHARWVGWQQAEQTTDEQQ